MASFSLALLGASQAVGATVQHWTDTYWVLQTLAAPSYKQAQNARAGAFRLVRGRNRITLPSRLDDGLTPGVADDIRSAYGDLAAQNSLISVRSRWMRQSVALRQIPASRVRNGGLWATFEAASVLTGVSASYLERIALRESAWAPYARAKTSSASGVFQFLEGTWLDTVGKYGASAGLGWAARLLQTSAGGRALDPAARARILDLRYDPMVAATMAGWLTVRNAQSLSRTLGRPPSAGELYMAHVLGPSDAATLLQIVRVAPSVSAARIFPNAARSNQSLFYNRGTPKTALRLYVDLIARGD